MKLFIYFFLLSISINCFSQTGIFPVGPGIGTKGEFHYGVLSLFCTEDSLYVGSTNNSNKLSGFKNIGLWDGTRFHDLNADTLDGVVYTSVIYNGNLVVGGDFYGNNQNYGIIAQRVNGEWKPMGPGCCNSGDDIRALCVYKGELYAGGAFLNIGGVKNLTSIARWDGTKWKPVGKGVEGAGREVRAMTVFNGELIVGGSFTSAGGVEAYCVAKWNGTRWSPLGQGIGNIVNSLYADTVNNILVAGGGFEGEPGDTTVSTAIAQFDGISWKKMGQTNFFKSNVYTLCGYHGKIYAGSGFDQKTDPKFSVWDGNKWEMVIPQPDEQIKALRVFKDDLYLAGGFLTFGGDSIYRIARYHNDDKVGVFQLADKTQEKNKTIFFPNPFINKIKIDLEHNENAIIQLILYDVLGNRKKEFDIKEGTKNKEFDFSDLNTGIYLVKLINSSNNEVIVKRLIKN